jgi:hypothetical protein
MNCTRYVFMFEILHMGREMTWLDHEVMEIAIILHNVTIVAVTTNPRCVANLRLAFCDAVDAMPS